MGTYGILSYEVTERRPEIGVRMALGAGRGSVLNLILGQGIRLTAAGLAVGVGSSVVLTRLLSSLLFGVEPADPATLAAVTVFMVLVALVACLVPAHRATRVDPMVVLRVE